MEDHDDVDLEVDGELVVFDRGARVQLREEHVRRDLDVLDAVTVSDLDVLHLGRLCLFFKCFHSNKLNLKGFDVELRVSLDDMAVEWLVELAVG